MAESPSTVLYRSGNWTRGRGGARHSRLIYAQHDAFHRLGSFSLGLGKTRQIREYAISHIFSSFMTQRARFYFLLSPRYFRMDHATSAMSHVVWLCRSLVSAAGTWKGLSLGTVDVLAQVLADVP